MPVLRPFPLSDVRYGGKRIGRMVKDGQQWPYGLREFLDDNLVDYWIQEDAKTGQDLASAKGVVELGLPISTVTAAGFQMSSNVSWPHTSTDIMGVVVAIQCTALNTGTPLGGVVRWLTAGWATGFRFDWAQPPNYANTVLNLTTLGSPNDRDVDRALLPGDTGVYAAGIEGTQTRFCAWPDRSGPGVYETSDFSDIRTPVSIDINGMDGTGLRYKMVGLLSGRPTAEFFDELVVLYGRDLHPL